MIEIFGFTFLLISVISIIVTFKNTKALAWGCLVPSYFLFMMLLFPIISYINQSYLNYIVVPNPSEISKLYFILTIAISFYLFFYQLNLIKKTNFNTDTVIVRLSNFVDKTYDNDLIIFFVLFLLSLGSLWSLFYGYFGLVKISEINIYWYTGILSLSPELLSYLNIILWIKSLNSKPKTSIVLFAYFSLFLLICLSFFSNSKLALMLPLVQIFLCSYYQKNKLSLSMVIIGFLIFQFIVFPVIHGFRYSYYFLNQYDSFILLFTDFIEYFFSFEWIFLNVIPEGGSNLSLGRGTFSYLTYIINNSGNNIDFLDGSTYLHGLGILIPRFLYSDKVEMDIGNWTGRLFDHVNQSDFITNVSPTFIGEFYMNHGLIGVIIGMSLLGIFVRFIDEFIYKSTLTWFKVLLTTKIFWLESFIGMTFLVFVKFILAFYLLTLLARLFCGYIHRFTNKTDYTL